MKVEFESECECGGIINGSGWCDDDYYIYKFDYQECDTCGWNQAS